MSMRSGDNTTIKGGNTTGMARPRTLCEAFQRTASVDPEAVALRTVGGTRTVTWREYADEVRAVAAGLNTLSVIGPGQPTKPVFARN